MVFPFLIPLGLSRDLFLLLHSIVIKIYILYDFSLFIEICFIAPNICLGVCFVCTWKECALCYCWVVYSINVNWVELIESVVQVYYVSILCLLFPSVIERDIKNLSRIVNFSILKYFSLLFCFTHFDAFSRNIHV